jgi:hypothetical protein
MATRFGGRLRPHLQILKWVSLGGDGSPALPPGMPSPLLPSPEPAAQAPLERKAEAKTGSFGARIVEEPTLKEEMGDDIPF